jgi:protein TonB
MLDQLVESKSNRRENKTRGGYLLTTFVLVVGLCFSAVLWSLFAQDLGMGNDEFELSTLVTPVPISENAPSASLPKQVKHEQSPKTKSDEITRQTNILRVEEGLLAPDKISVVPNMQKARPNGFFLQKDGIENDIPSSSGNDNGRADGVGIGLSNNQTAQAENVEKAKLPPPPEIKKPVTETAQQPKKPLISTGVINGKAKYLPKPVYSAAAKALNVAGDVSVQVLIDEAGNVVSAKAIDGHPLLKIEAEKAARNAKFDPTLLSNQPVKVSGVIVYKFSTQ